jgi:hypothetical protein
MATPKAWLLPAVLALITGLGTAVFVHQHQPDYPPRFAAFQMTMLGATMLLAAPQRWLSWVSLLLLLGGTLIASMSVGMFYLPTLAAAGWVAARRHRETAESTPGFLDTKPKSGIIYTESELDAIRHRQSR